MRILPVMDLLRGQVVRGVAGDRAKYRPIKSQWTTDAEPDSIARACAAVGFRDCYVADLDAIAGTEPDWDAYSALLSHGLDLWVDAGCARVGLAEKLTAFRFLDSGLKHILIGLETLESPDDLRRLVQAIGPETIVFSLDLKHGQPMTRIPAWREANPLSIAAFAIDCAVQRTVVLDLATVGVGGGPSTLALCSDLRRAHPELEITSGGGVRGVGDLRTLASAGCDYVLVASALHDGRISVTELREFL